MKRKILFLFVALILVTSLVIGGCAAQEPTPTPAPAPAPTTKPIELKYMIAYPEDSEWNTAFFLWIDRVMEKTGGELELKFVGGPEAISQFKQGEAVSNGVIDIIHGVPGYYWALVPEEAGSTMATEITPSEEREVGYYDLINEIHQKANMFYLGRTAINSPFVLSTNAHVEKPSDIKGLVLRSMIVYDPFFKALGATTEGMGYADTYTAMERGVIDGFGSGVLAYTPYSFWDVTKYYINHPFYEINLVIVANLDTWNKIPAHLQKVMIDEMINVEKEVGAIFGNFAEGEMERIKQHGVEIVEFSPADAKQYNDLAKEVYWEGILKNSPEYGPKFEQMLRK